MPKKMLIDATHPEETRVVVVDGNRVEEFDFESSSRRQLSGNIYLAKVTRVEPSLQAAFVEYGGNRHGFLAFSEIHPDYYQIPLADREALLAAEEAERDEDDEDAAPKKKAAPKPRARGARKRRPKGDEPETASPDVATATPDATEGDAPEAKADAAQAETPEAAERRDAPADDAASDESAKPSSIAEGAGADDAERVSEPYDADAPDASPAAEPGEIGGEGGGRRRSRGRRRRKGGSEEAAAETAADAPEATPETAPATVEQTADDDDAPPRDAGIESVGAEEPRDEAPRRKPRMRSYKIQEVVKVRQIMLVQVVKEERGNKGAALTTYLSLAGRYCVLMPNTARGGGISRKITQAEDRKKLKEIAGEFEVPRGMGLIIRTAGAKRTRAEIRRDYEYLLRQWEDIRTHTLQSVAPTLIYEEGSLIKRSIRDLYAKDIDEVLVEGEDGYREAKDYMRMLMPSHAKNVKNYKDLAPVFTRFQVESQLSAMFNPTVQLKSGGYIVIGITEALVAIDVNSGRATRQGSIEETALQTNLEAADEVARQLRLRDLAGLIVIDFIDMDERRNNAAVEKRMKDRLSTDRARLQIGRISGFGLMEMSRQRLRPGMLEASTAPCPACHGTGLVRSEDSLALCILRAVEEEGVKGKSAALRVTAPVSIANYIMNQKRAYLLTIEQRYGLTVTVEGDPTLLIPDFTVDRVKGAPRREAPPAAVQAHSGFVGLDDPREDEEEEATPPAENNRGEARRADDGDSDAESRNRRRRGKRGGRRRRRDEDGEAARDDNRGDDAATRPAAATPGGMEVFDAEPTTAAAVDTSDETDTAPKKPRRRRSRRSENADTAAADATADAVADATTEVATDATTDVVAAPDDPTPAPDAPAEGAPEEDAAAVTAAANLSTEAAAPPADAGPAPATDAVAADAVAPTPPAEPATEDTAAATAPSEPAEPESPPQPKRRGWWSLGRG